LLATENNRILTVTKFNGQPILDGTVASFAFQVGANSGEQISVATQGATPFIAVTAGDLLTQATASTAIVSSDTDLDSVSGIRASWGANQNLFEQVISNLRVAAENSAASAGRIMDADYAKETANLSRTQILQQAGTAMVAQANQLPQSVLSLLRQ